MEERDTVIHLLPPQPDHARDAGLIAKDHQRLVRLALELGAPREAVRTGVRFYRCGEDWTLEAGALVDRHPHGPEWSCYWDAAAGLVVTDNYYTAITAAEMTRPWTCMNYRTREQRYG